MITIIKKILTIAFFITLLPLLAIIALLIWLTMGAPIIFRQKRIGFNGQPFTLYKFRTMSNQVDIHGNLLPDELRLTPLGNLLRKTSLDELPQIWNILKGDLVWVGPRPFVLEFYEHFTDEQHKRHLVKPGITGWAQINGRNAISHDEKFHLDLWYVKNKSLILDLKILLKTIPIVLSAKNINISDSQQRSTD